VSVLLHDIRFKETGLTRLAISHTLLLLASRQKTFFTDRRLYNKLGCFIITTLFWFFYGLNLLFDWKQDFKKSTIWAVTSHQFSLPFGSGNSRNTYVNIAADWLREKDRETRLEIKSDLRWVKKLFTRQCWFRKLVKIVSKTSQFVRHIKKWTLRWPVELPWLF
jgi:hypothetical protein